MDDFFTNEEKAFLSSAAELIFPADALSAGAQSLQVVRFIDLQMRMPYGFGERNYLSAPFAVGSPSLGYQLPYTPRDLYRTALERLFRWIAEKFDGKKFQSLSQAEQIKLLEDMEDGKIDLGDIPSEIFFKEFHRNVLEGVFSDPLYGGNTHMEGWTFLGFPGARAEFMAWINQNGAKYPYPPVAIPLSFEKMERFWQMQDEGSGRSV